MSHEDRLINSLFLQINIATYKRININQEHTTGENIKWYQSLETYRTHYTNEWCNLPLGLSIVVPIDN